MKRIAVSFFCALLCAMTLAGCGKSGLDEEEMRQTFRSLVEASYELNEIYYGEGLPYQVNEALMNALTGMNAAKTSYMPVAEDAPYKSEAAIRAATEEVFSDDICQHLFQIAFSGMSTEEDELVAYARYIEKNEILTVRVDLKSESLPMGRQYDFSQMKIISDEKNRVCASFPSEIDGKASVNVKITMIKTAEGWRLDSPTY